MDIDSKIMLMKEEIMEEARKKKEKIISEEKAKWEKKYQSFKQDLKEQDEEIQLKYQNEADRHKEQINSRAILNKKKKEWARLNELLSDFIGRLQQRLLDFKGDKKYLVYLKMLVDQALDLLQGKEFTISLNQEDKELYAELQGILKDEYPEYKFKLKDEDLAISGGVRVEEAAGRELVEYSFEAILDMFREEIAVELQKKVN